MQAISASADTTSADTADVESSGMESARMKSTNPTAAMCVIGRRNNKQCECCQT
jgi:hypothetical protein